MCDTFVVPAQLTVDGSVLLGKNSDREPNEAQEVDIYAAADYAAGSQVQCTYREIPQVEHTFAVLLSRPFWMFGAEMGLNEHGVAIGNEAIFTRVPYEKTGLTGMDLLRLALERSRSAFEALQTITTLLETYGQGGNCGFTHPFYYHNSFLIADPREAWVLETAGREWVAEQVRGVRSISNAATIGAEWDLSSEGVVRYAMQRGWCKNRDDFHFARCYSDALYSTLSGAQGRQACTTGALRSTALVDAHAAMQVLRLHSAGGKSNGRVDQSLLRQTVCMHAGAGPVRNSQTVASLVAHLTPERQTAWLTGTAAPCTSIFKPVWLDAGLPYQEPALGGAFDPRCLWWRHEQLHRAVLRDFSGRIGLFQAERDTLEREFFERSKSTPPERAARLALSEECFRAAEQAEAGWLARVSAAPVSKSPRLYYAGAWNTWQRQAKMDQRI